MISKVKNAMSTLVGGMMPHGHHHHHHHHNHHSGGGQTCEADSLPPRFPYGRPDFLDLTPELLQYSTEHASRPVLTLKRGSRLPWRTGYAEWVGQGIQSTKCPQNHSHLRMWWLHYSPDVCQACVAAASAALSALQQPNNGQHGLLLLYRVYLSVSPLSCCKWWYIWGCVGAVIWQNAPCHYTDILFKCLWILAPPQFNLNG